MHNYLEFCDKVLSAIDDSNGMKSHVLSSFWPTIGNASKRQNNCEENGRCQLHVKNIRGAFKKDSLQSLEMSFE